MKHLIAITRQDKKKIKKIASWGFNKLILILFW